MKIPKQKQGSKYIKRIIIALVVLGGIAYGVFYVWKMYQETDTTTLFNGQVVCLPLKASPEPENPETCQKGIKNESGLYYGVQQISQAQLILERSVIIKGNLDPVSDGVGDNYAIAGVISGQLVTKRSR